MSKFVDRDFVSIQIHSRCLNFKACSKHSIDQLNDSLTFKVGVLENRVYDQLFVLKKKGKPIEFKDCTELLLQLQNGVVDGIIF